MTEEARPRFGGAADPKWPTKVGLVRACLPADTRISLFKKRVRT
ncbi:hypothetical protein [Novosphingobium sp. ERN07]|nr:hypothetical protein [Novosphingobium sp. ERN07]